MSSGRKEAPCACVLEDDRSLEMYPTIGLRVRCRDVDGP